VVYISGAGFEEHCFNISRDVLDWVLNCFGGATYDVITYNTKTRISLKQKKIFQKGKRHSSLL